MNRRIHERNCATPFVQHLDPEDIQKLLGRIDGKQSKEPLIRPHNGKNGKYHALVGREIILAELRRHPVALPPIANANFTGRKARYSTQSRSGWYWDLCLETCLNFRTTEASLDERERRLAARPESNATAPSVPPVAETFPLQPAPSNVFVFPCREPEPQGNESDLRFNNQDRDKAA